MSAKAKIIVTRQLEKQATAKFEGLEVVTWMQDCPADRQWLLSMVKGAAGVLCMFNDRIDAELLAAAGPSLRVISTFSAGTDHIALEATRELGIVVGHTPDILSDSVADTTILLILAATRRLREAWQVVLDGRWPAAQWSPYFLCGRSLGRATIGFVGFGSIGQTVARRLVSFGPNRFVYYSRRRLALDVEQSFDIPTEHATLLQLAKQSDVIVVLCAGGQSTHHLIDSEFFLAMAVSAGGRGGYVVNAARGSVVDSTALYEALECGSVAGAALDVLEGEPYISAHHPLVTHPRCIVLPHIGSADMETRTQMGCLAAENLVRGVSGQPLIRPVQ